MRLGPDATDDVLVQRLAAAQAQPETPRCHGALRRGGLRDHCRVVAKRRARHARPKGQRLGRRAQCSHPGPHKGVVALLGHPGLEVIGRHYSLETVLLGQRAIA
jgi:hypothetical protein